MVRIEHYEVCVLRKFLCGHWSIENELHWILDLVFGKDGKSKDHASENLTVLKKADLSTLKRREPEKKQVSSV
jgi:predicted transposase YbfD/YdcC